MGYGKFELYKLLDEGMDALQEKKVRPFRVALANIEKGMQECAKLAEMDLRAYLGSPNGGQVCLWSCRASGPSELTQVVPNI